MAAHATATRRAIVRAEEETAILRRIEKLRSLLVTDEKLECYAIQRRIFALLNRRIVVACTTGRLLIMRPNILPGYRLEDIRWQDLRNAHLQEGIFGSTLTIRVDARASIITGLRKDEAQVVYRFCQTQEQNWREKNRVRQMEEARAKAGGVLINSALSADPATIPATPSAATDAKARLAKAKEMLNAGLITDAEYEAAKAKILSSL